jgi:hypothetical protein
MPFFYHYTDKCGAEAIRASMTLRESKVRIGDAYHGDGVYFTTKSPLGLSKLQIALNNYGNPELAKQRVAGGRLDYIVWVKCYHLLVTKFLISLMSAGNAG